MNRNINKWGTVALTIAITIGNTACSDEFLEEKKLYGKYSEATVYANYETAKNRIDNIYYMLYPGQKEGNGSQKNLVSTGLDDDWAKTTEEYGGLTDWENSSKEQTYKNVEDHFYVENKEISPYGHVREINEVIENVQKYGKDKLEEDQYNAILGQAYFLRAWRYWMMVRWTGGVPIISKVQNALVGNGEGLDLVVPRASTKECIEFICTDLDKAAELLPASWEDEVRDWGRVTAGTALAMKGRILLHWASPLWNRTNDPERWNAAYEANKVAIAKLEEGGFGLAYEGNSGGTNKAAQNWAKMFLDLKGSDGNVNEAVFVTLYNNVDKVSNWNKWNDWEHQIRPKNAYGNGGKHPTAEMVDLFPMADGKIASESEYDYDRLCFFMNRDPRFYRTFAFPGVDWQYEGNTKDELGKTSDEISFEGGTTLQKNYPYNGNQYVLWSYTFYKSANDMVDLNKAGYASDGIGSLKDKSSVYIRKRSCGVNGVAATYTYKAAPSSETTGQGFQQCASPYMEMRFAEVLLNYAEAAAAIGKDNEAFEVLKRIRSRVYDSTLAESNYGLNPGLSGGQLIASILFERQIELAYEGKRFEDMRRWMLFDGGVGQEALGANFKVTGWGGNTCTYLGLTPTNGREKYHYIELYADENVNKEEPKNDPILKVAKRNEKIQLWQKHKGENNLKKFYETYLNRKDRYAEGTDETVTIKWSPNYYIFGLCNSAMVNNPTLYQNIGWEDISHGGDGIFDPLETDPAKIPVDTDTGYEI